MHRFQKTKYNTLTNISRKEHNPNYRRITREMIKERTERLSLLRKQTKKSKQRQNSIGIEKYPVSINEDTFRKIKKYWEQRKKRETIKVFSLYLMKYKYKK